MLAKLKVDYVLAGHSERRALFGETDVMVNKKVKAILANAMTPILCVGETLEDREAGDTLSVVTTQLMGGLDGMDADAVTKTVVAYEPVWAIGTGRTATPKMLQRLFPPYGPRSPSAGVMQQSTYGSCMEVPSTLATCGTHGET